MREGVAFFQRHPAVRDALIWALPAMAFGLVLRILLMAYQPLAYWGSDSESYYLFAHRFLSEGAISIPEKCRFLYPILLLLLSLFPGTPLQWLAVFQHAMGLLTLAPLAYVVRKTFLAWKAWIVPATALYAGMPILLWYEHELLGESFFFATIVWMYATWTAWSSQLFRGNRGEGVWWIFFACFTMCVLTKPAARFLWPGVVIGLLYLRAWRYLRWPQWVGLATLFGVMLTLGERMQASRLLYSTVFPLTVLDSPLHADLKAEIAPMVEESRKRLDYYYLEDRDLKNFLSGDFREGNFPAWQTLDRQGSGALQNAMRDLALEAIRSNPHLFLYIAIQRAVGSINWTIFKLNRYDPTYFSHKLEPDFDEFVKKGANRKLQILERAFNIKSANDSFAFSEIREKVEPKGQEMAAESLMNYVNWMSARGVFVAEPEADGFSRTLWQLTPTMLGWWLIIGCLTAWGVPDLRRTLGIWLAIAIGYAITVHLVGSGNPRFFAAAWPPLVLALFAPLDGVYRLLIHIQLISK